MDGNSPILKRVEPDLAETIQSSIAYLDAPPDDAYAEECFRTLRHDQWHQIQALRSKMATVLEQGGAPALTPEELSLAADVVDCASILRAKDEEHRAAGVSSIAAVAGIAATILGIIAVSG